MENFDTQFQKFFAGATKIYTDYMMEHYPSQVEEMQYSEGKRYIRLYRVGTQTSAHCFVDKTTGDVLKVATWKAPAKGSRGNIFNEDNGLGGMDHYGAKYLR